MIIDVVEELSNFTTIVFTIAVGVSYVYPYLTKRNPKLRYVRPVSQGHKARKN